MDAANLKQLYPVFLEAKPKPLTDHEKIKTNKYPITVELIAD